MNDALRTISCLERENAGLHLRLPNEYSIEVKSALVLSKLLDCIDCSDDVFLHLADLIDRPTCSNAYDDSGMHVAAHVTWFDCSECHCKVRTDMIGSRIRYCPNCGAEVIE